MPKINKKIKYHFKYEEIEEIYKDADLFHCNDDKYVSQYNEIKQNKKNYINISNIKKFIEEINKKYENYNEKIYQLNLEHNVNITKQEIEEKNNFFLK